ncbi:hypothetical protein ACIQ7Q_21680 [Streptomyces sp. NPDC096176]|uniref:hypothetical protein n=1 Tax=Streptomyces sp. NPDC096176 TaxID=3366079 RepID=UPI003804862C
MTTTVPASEAYEKGGLFLIVVLFLIIAITPLTGKRKRTIICWLGCSARPVTATVAPSPSMASPPLPPITDIRRGERSNHERVAAARTEPAPPAGTGSVVGLRRLPQADRISKSTLKPGIAERSRDIAQKAAS